MRIIIILILFPLICLGQKQGNIWYFGVNAGLDFSTGIPFALNNGQTNYACDNLSEGSSVICDSSGSLLFYCNGKQIWNKNQQIMPNGDSLLSNASATQGSIIVPQPGSSRLFYVFTVDDFDCDNLQYGFRYSIVDICLDNGNGDIISGKKNVLLLDTVAEKLTAVRHSNGIDYWIIVHKYYSDAFYSYHLSSTGIVDTVISHIGSRHPTGPSVGAAIGELKASPNGHKLVIVNGQDVTNIAEYFDFDNSTGMVSNCVSIQTNPAYSYYGVSFSPDNSKLYISCWLNNNGIYQFDLNAGNGNADSVKASKKQITNLTSYAIQLAIDGKIYLARVANPEKYLAIINNPNNTGLNCHFQDSAIYLNGKIGSMGLPNFIDSYDYSNTEYNCETGIAINNIDNQVDLFPNPFTYETTISFSQEQTNTSIKITDILGKEVKALNFSGKNCIIEKGTMQAGIYFVQIIDEKKNVVNRKIVVQ